MESEVLLGMLASVASLIFFGSYTVPLKFPSALTLDPVVFQLYKSTACFLTSWLVLLYTPYRFTWWGMLGALIWVTTGTIAICAVRWAGIGVSQCLWSGLSLFISYIWGAYIFKEPLKNHGLSILSLLVMAFGMAGVALSVSEKTLVYYLIIKLRWKSSTNQDLQKFGRAEHNDLLSPLQTRESSGVSIREKHTCMTGSLCKGILGASFVGILNGSFMVPLKYANKDVVGVEYLVSFGIGAMTMSIMLTSLYLAVLFFKSKPLPSLYVPKAASPAILAGILWSLGNYFSIYATLYLGVALGWPLVQCQLLVSALWAVFYYREVETKAQAVLLICSSGIVVLGVILLSHFGSIG